MVTVKGNNPYMVGQGHQYLWHAEAYDYANHPAVIAAADAYEASGSHFTSDDVPRIEKPQPASAEAMFAPQPAEQEAPQLGFADRLFMAGGATLLPAGVGSGLEIKRFISFLINQEPLLAAGLFISCAGLIATFVLAARRVHLIRRLGYSDELKSFMKSGTLFEASQSFRKLVNEERWSDVEEALYIANNVLMDAELCSELKSIVVRNVSSKMPSRVLVTTVDIQGKWGESIAAMILLAGREDWDSVIQVLKGSDRLNTRSQFCAALVGTVLGFGDAVPDRVLMEAALIKRQGVENALLPFSVLMKRDAKSEIDEVLSRAGRKFRRAFESALENGIDVSMDDGELAMEIALRPLTEMIDDGHWVKLESAFRIVGKTMSSEGVRISQETLIEKLSPQMPDSLLEAAAVAGGSFEHALTLLDELLDRRAWEHVINIIRIAARDEGGKYVNRLIQEVQNREDASPGFVHSSVFGAAAVNYGDPDSFIGAFKVLLIRRAVNELDKVIAHADEVNDPIMKTLIFVSMGAYRELKAMGELEDANHFILLGLERSDDLDAVDVLGAYEQRLEEYGRFVERIDVIGLLNPFPDYEERIAIARDVLSDATSRQEYLAGFKRGQN